MIKVLAISSSRVGNSGYLQMAAPMIKEFLGDQHFKIAFVPFASVDKDYEGYVNMVREGLKDLPYTIDVVTDKNAKEVIEGSDVIMTGGGNTFTLLHNIYALDILELIKTKVQNGTPYIGWSAGANITGRTISTTNDMPIIQPQSFDALAFLPFQINPHYINEVKEGHNGETRDQRLSEFVLLHPSIPVVGIPEGTALQLINGKLELIGQFDGVLFTTGQEGKVEKKPIVIGTDLTYLMQQ